MSDLVMRLETAAVVCDRIVSSDLVDYDYLHADWRDLFQEAARRIKELEHEYTFGMVRYQGNACCGR